MKYYKKLKEQLNQITTLGQIGELLYWDMDVNTPAKAIDSRVSQMSLMEVQINRIYQSKEFSKNLDKAEKEVSKNGSDWDKANVKIAKERHAYATAIPEKLVKDLSEAHSIGGVKWKEAKDKADFSIFLPALKKVFELNKKKAEILSEKLGCTPYDALLSANQPGLKQKDIDPVFNDLKEFLPKFYEEVQLKQKNMKKPVFEDKYTVEKQRRLNRVIAKKMGYDFSKGRLDETEHPYTLASDPNDARITNHYYTNDPVDPISSVIHEAGHGMYQQALPEKDRGQPVAENAGAAIHESMSLLAECCFGKSKEYSKYISKMMQKEFGKDEKLSQKSIDAYFNKQENNLIRIKAGEVTYPLHIIMRYEIEKDILNGKMDCKDLPKVWAEKSQKYFGIKPKNDAEGCLQDMHWSDGSIGYFPSYSIGAITAAQMLETIKKQDPNAMKKAEKGDLSAMNKFVKENVASHGASLGFADLVKKATGKEFSADAYKKYLRSKYLGEKDKQNTKQIISNIAKEGR